MKKITDLEFFRNRSVRIWSAVIAIVLFLAGTAGLIGVLSSQMFTANPRFTLRHLRVKSLDRGFWKGRKDLICDILRIREGETNLFRLNPRELRSRLLVREPSIQSVRIIRELPDTLYVDITERTPVALVNSPRSALVVDSQSILMQKKRCMDISSSLPVILGLPHLSGLPPGSTIHEFEAAVHLIMLTKTAYPDIRIGAININRKGQMICSVFYKDGKDFYRVVMPNQELSKNLQVLSTTLEKMRKSKNTKRNINLLFQGQVIITDSRLLPEKAYI
ncbi:MAG: FtsQ-type POTRA domain-containing protein [Lentisphaeria bacterium]|nr:FtsQ-type POTRA domain-containing protein [Lentisphaeria bacterium]